MTLETLSDVTFAELRKRLKAHVDDPNSTDSLDTDELLTYLTELPDHTHTVDSGAALAQLARHFAYAAQPSKSLLAASHAAQVAIALKDRELLYTSRVLEGVALSELGNFTEAVQAHAEGWSLARAMPDPQREIWAIGNLGAIFCGMCQWDAAIQYLEKAREIAEEHKLDELEFHSRVNLADCAVQLRAPELGFKVLSKFIAGSNRIRPYISISALAHMTLALLYLQVDDLDSARHQAEESARLATMARLTKQIPQADAVLAVIEVRSGAIEKGLEAVEMALEQAKRHSQVELPQFFAMCIDAYEAAGQPERALKYLRQLVAWRKKTIGLALPPVQVGNSKPLIHYRRGAVLFEDELDARAHTLKARIGERTQRYLEMAINAEMACGFDLYRTFRIAKLSQQVGLALGWHQERISSLSFAARLYNIGMLAMPTRLLRKRGGLSLGERNILRDHTRYGAQLLRSSRLHALISASVVAEEHHEHYDGSGYPHGLVGDAITKEARVVALCDAFDAMTHTRPWRMQPLSVEASLSRLQHDAGTQFDPALTQIFVDIVRRDVLEYADFEAFLTEGADELDYVRTRARMETLLLRTPSKP